RPWNTTALISSTLGSIWNLAIVLHPASHFQINFSTHILLEGFCPAQEGGVAKVNSRQLAFNTLHKIQEPPAMQVVVLLVCCDDPRVQGWMLHIIKELSMYLGTIC
ncbi:Os10g0412800, partial [Oryza sativa Japonica Group]